MEISTKQWKMQAIEFMNELARIMPDANRQKAIVIHNVATNIKASATEAERQEFNWGWRIERWDSEELPLYPQANMFACIASITKTANAKTGKMRYWRHRSAFASGLAFYIDDIGNGKGSKGDFQLDELNSILPPTAVVETSPNNYQAWYFFDEPVTDQAYFNNFLSSFVNQVLTNRGGDRTIKDVVRIGRIPYGYNNKVLSDGSLKYPDADGKPWRVRLFSWDYSRRYNLSSICAAFNVEVIAESSAVPRSYEKDDLLMDSIFFAMAKVIMQKMDMGEATGMELRENQSGKIRCKCIWGHEHTNGDPTGAYLRGPIAGEVVPFLYHCAHDTCKKRAQHANKGLGGMWELFTDTVVMPHIYDALTKAGSEERAEEYLNNNFK